MMSVLNRTNGLGQDYFREPPRANSFHLCQWTPYLSAITDIFAECVIDYDRNSEITKNFYAMVQNKFHFAITGNTAAEIIYHKQMLTRIKRG